MQLDAWYESVTVRIWGSMKDWVEELKTNVVDKNLVIAIACNKADLDTRQVSRARAEQFARSIGAVVGVMELIICISSTTPVSRVSTDLDL